MAGEQYQTPISEDVARQLADKGYLDVPFMDKIYGQLAAEENTDADQTKEKVATDVANQIATNPEVAEIAGKVQAKLIPRDMNADVIRESPGLVERIGQGVGQVARGVVRDVGGAVNDVLVQPAKAIVQTAAGVAAPLAEGIVSGYTGEQPAPVAAPAIDVGQTGNPAGYSTSPQSPPVEPILPPDAVADAEAGNTSGVNEKFQEIIQGAESAYREAGQAASSGAASVTNALSAGQNTLEDLAKQNAARIQTDEQAFQLQKEKIDNAYADIQKEGINPERWWQNQSTFGKVGSVIAVFLGGLKLHGDNTPNAAMDYITRAIDQDIASQKASIELKKFGIQGKENLLSRMLEKTNSITQAESLTRAALADSVNARVEMAKVGAQNASTQATLKLGLQELRLKALDTAYKMGAMDVSAGIGAADTSGIPNVPEGFDAFSWNKNLAYKKRGTAIPGVGVINPGVNSRNVKDVAELKGNLDSFNSKVDKLIIGAEKAGPRLFLNRKGDAALKTMHGELLADLARMESRGTLHKGVLDLVKQELGNDPAEGGLKRIVNNKWSGENYYVEQLKTAKQTMSEEMIRRMAPFLVMKDPALFAGISADPKDLLVSQAEPQSRATGLNSND